MEAAKWILRYVKGTNDYGLVYAREPKGKLKVFTDNNYARDIEDRRSTSGYACLLSKVAICWSSRKQDILALSSTEDGYVVVTNCACHCV
ncbi:unnamed protein product [Lactuca virosa]|uniref:Uncharacterized protein n=1 Tax=Lactuca virosa TaxID=75947 RepID=A0AAU9MBG4_9ASTR|nr:unnamed protein product [Lactuca virosa]